jgi:hypothetical protein
MAFPFSGLKVWRTAVGMEQGELAQATRIPRWRLWHIERRPDLAMESEVWTIWQALTTEQGAAKLGPPTRTANGAR